MKLLKILSATVFAVIAIAFINTDSALASWSKGVGSVDRIEMSTRPGDCPYVQRTGLVQGYYSQTILCMANEGNIRLGVHLTTRGYLPVIGIGQSSLIYEFEAPCVERNSCFYSDIYNTLVVKRVIPGTLNSKLAIYRNFTDRLTRVATDFGLSVKYRFDDSQPDYVVADSSPLLVGGIGISSNGRWLGVEFRERGYGVMDLNNLSLKRVSTDMLFYDYGDRPRTEIAISNRGDYLLVTGQNAGLSIYDVTDSCGEYSSIEQIRERTNLKVACNSRINQDDVVDRFKKGTKPVFSANGEQFSLIATDYDHRNYRVVVSSKDIESGGYIDYLALGDSFTSGEGEESDDWYMGGTNYGEDNCHLSLRSYPFLLESFGEPKSVACSGATIRDILGDSGYAGQGGRLKGRANVDSLRAQAIDNFMPGYVPQLEFVARYKPSVVTVGIGGNDIGFMGKLSACLAPGNCHWVSDIEAKQQTVMEIQSLFDKLIHLYSEIQRVSPGTKIYTIGYPKIINPDGVCPVVLDTLITKAEARFMNEGISYLNDVIEAASSSSGAHYIDAEDVYGARALCGHHSERAIKSFRLGDDIGVGAVRLVGNESFHPTPIGHRLMATRIMDLVSDTAHCTVAIPRSCGVMTGAPEVPAYWGEVVAINGRYYQADMVPEKIKRLEKVPVSMRTLSFRPSSGVSMSIFSDETYLGSVSASENGAVVSHLVLPGSLAVGYHTLKFSGLSYSDEPVTYYQIVYVAPDDEEDAAGSKSSPITVTDRFDKEGLATLTNSNLSLDGVGRYYEGSLSAVNEVEKPQDADVLGQSANTVSGAVSPGDIADRSLPGWLYVWVAFGLLFIAIVVFFTKNKT